MTAGAVPVLNAVLSEPLQSMVLMALEGLERVLQVGEAKCSAGRSSNNTVNAAAVGNVPDSSSTNAYIHLLMPEKIEALEVRDWLYLALSHVLKHSIC